MIARERLEELIKQRAMIWTIDYNRLLNMEITPDTDTKNIVICELFLDDNMFIRDNILYKYEWRIALENLYETKEDVEFALRYQNITRTETLSLPTWEEIKRYGQFTFEGKDKIKYTLRYISGFNTLSLYGYTTEYYGDFTLDNYYKCCELCRKLFLGEEVEECYE